MQDPEQLLRYLQQGVNDLLEQGAFDNGWEFKLTQNEALRAYKNFLNDERLTPEQRLKGYFEIPTGVGKTAIFIGIIAAAHKAAFRDGEELKTAIVVPTVQLLEQTRKAFELFAPQLHNQIGLYGGGRRSLSHPLTIMTYDAWYDLSQSGKISSENIDILISDEAHRGTSERRIENIKGIFNALTAQIAFTATAHFDEEKSVEASHEREIFYKPMREAIKAGELCSYVQSQRAVIRVEPSDYMLSEAFTKATEGDQIKYRRALRQRAWNDFAVKAFREGRDERTGDLLTDNQAGFFVDGTQQADELEELLNADSELQRRATEQGKKGVAVSIHSYMSPKEQKRRFEAYLRGEYMAVIGDEKFKEGFDHPPMKTIIDYPHSSVVDKLQILGRGARQWWNEAKQRYEGLTVIDTAIYIGSPDEKENEQLKNNALRYSVSVKDVLEESAVFADDEESWFPKGRGGYGSGRRGYGHYVFADNPNIEYITDLEEIYALEQAIDKICEGFVLRMSDVIKTIDAYREANNDKNPAKKSGEITEGPLAGQSNWRALDASIQKGQKGLKEDPEWQRLNDKLGEGKVTLSNLLVELGYRKQLPKLTMDIIIETINAYREANEGKNPKAALKQIEDGPLADLMTWDTLYAALVAGARSLKEDPEWKRLNQKLGKITLPALLADLGYKDQTREITIQEVCETIEAYRAAHNNKNPTVSSGNMSEGPLTGLLEWGQLNQMLSLGSNGFREDDEWQRLNEKLGTVTLSSLLIELGYKEKPLELTIAAIRETVEVYRRTHDGKNPSQHSGDITEGSLAGLITWGGLNSALRVGGNNLKEDPEWQRFNKQLGKGKTTLPNFLIECGYKEKPLRLTIAFILELIQSYRDDNNMANPSATSQNIETGSLKGMRWVAISESLRDGAYGLKEDPAWQRLNERYNGKLSLSIICKKYPAPNPARVFEHAPHFSNDS